MSYTNQNYKKQPDLSSLKKPKLLETYILIQKIMVSRGRNPAVPPPSTNQYKILIMIFIQKYFMYAKSHFTIY